MRLTDLLGLASDTVQDPEIRGLTADSRSVRPGDLFAALPGVQADGRDFIPQAVAAGASVVLAPQGTDVPPGVVLIEARNPRRRYAELAARFFGPQPKTQIAVTGTNGKTSTVEFVRQIWQDAGCEAASVGTLGVVSGPLSRPGGLTTPDPARLHEMLHDLAMAGVDHVALEASSHGLDQHRLDGVSLSAAAFTNLTRDHLDYHKTERNYLFAKARLIGELLSPGQPAVIHLGTPAGLVMEDLAWGRGLATLTVGRDDRADLRLVDQTASPDGQCLSGVFEGRLYQVDLPLIGTFQADNVLVAAGLAIVTGTAPDAAFAALGRLQGVPGRMQYLGSTGSGGSVFVDYAHTPDGLAAVLSAARAHHPARLHVVFGCGGDRDPGKRSEMGAAAAGLADCVYVTDDNPRSENAAAIRDEIMAACPGAANIGDRKAATQAAVEALKAGDILIVAGKGHEEGQIIGDTVRPYSDIETVACLLGMASGPVRHGVRHGGEGNGL